MVIAGWLILRLINIHDNIEIILTYLLLYVFGLLHTNEISVKKTMEVVKKKNICINK